MYVSSISRIFIGEFQLLKLQTPVWRSYYCNLHLLGNEQKYDEWAFNKMNNHEKTITLKE